MKILPVSILTAALTTSLATAGNFTLDSGMIGGGSLGRQEQADPGSVSGGNVLDSFSGKAAAQDKGVRAKFSQATVLAREAAWLMRQGKFVEADEKLRQAEALDGSNPVVLDAWTDFLAEQGKFDLARKYARRSIDMQPDSFAARFRYADLYVTEKRPAEAKEAFEHLLAEYPNSQLVWLKLLLAGLMGRQPDEVKKWSGHFAAGALTECSLFADAAVEFAAGNSLVGNTHIQECFREFGNGGRVRLLYESFARLGWVQMKNFPGLQGTGPGGEGSSLLLPRHSYGDGTGANDVPAARPRETPDLETVLPR